MLEKQRLSILPWSSSAGLPPADVEGFRWVRRIQDPAAGSILGFAGWTSRAPLLSWWQGKSIRVFETPDASLLVTLHRPIGPLRRWRVFDAEDRRIGGFHGAVLFDGAGGVLARFQGNPPPSESQISVALRGRNGGLGATGEGCGTADVREFGQSVCAMTLLARF